MTSIASAVGTNFVSFAAIIIAVISVVFQRQQTLIMAKQVERDITRELNVSEVPEGMPESALRKVLNRRLSDLRVQMKNEFGQRIERIEAALDAGHIRDCMSVAADALHVMGDYKTAAAEFTDSVGRMAAIEDAVREVQRTLDGVQRGIGSPALARAQIRGIAELLLSMASAEASVPEWQARQAPFESPD